MRATAQERESIARRQAETRRRLYDDGELDQLHNRPSTVTVQMVTGGGETTITVDHHGCHTAADCWPVHAPGVVAREAAGKWAADQGLRLQRVAYHGPQDVWLAYTLPEVDA